MNHNWMEMAFIEGIDVEYNNNLSVFEVLEERKTYRTGEMLCELARLDIRSLKDLLLKVPRFSESPDRNKMREIVGWLRDEMRKVYPSVISEMLCVEFLHCVSDYYKSKQVMRECIMNLDYLYLCDEFNEIYHGVEMLEYAFKDSGYKRPGSKTVGQLLLTMYLEINLVYLKTMEVFDAVVNDENCKRPEKKAKRIVDVIEKYSHLQEINYNILFYNNRLNSVYTIKTMMSLCLFELAHVYDANIQIVRCKNCGHWFVPKKRTDTRYCNYLAPDSVEKTCKEIGAQKAWAKKEKTDDVTREYRKVYMRYKMTVNRHPEKKDVQEKLEQLTDGIKKWRKKLSSGEVGKDEFLNWLAGF